MQLTPEGLKLKSFLDQWDPSKSKSKQAAERKATLSHAKEEALTQKLNDPANYDGENGINDFTKDFNNLFRTHWMGTDRNAGFFTGVSKHLEQALTRNTGIYKCS